MDIDLSILRMLEREKEISFEVLAEAIEQALLTAYQRATESSHPARVELDRKTGHVTVWAREIDEDGTEATGRIGASDDEKVAVEVSGTHREVAYADVKKALVQVEFNRPTKSDMDDVDDEEGGEA